MRCVCGRTIHPTWRDWLFLGVIVLAFASMGRAERERRNYRAAVKEVQAVARAGTLVVDSLRNLKCVVPGTIP